MFGKERACSILNSMSPWRYIILSDELSAAIVNTIYTSLSSYVCMSSSERGVGRCVGIWMEKIRERGERYELQRD